MPSTRNLKGDLMEKVFLITGAGRGLGAAVARAALAEGHPVVATGRRPEAVTEALTGPRDNLLTTHLDVTEPADAQAAVKGALEQFGRIDVLVNNAGNFYPGYFEEIASEHMRQQIDTNLFGPMNVTRAVLPVMRRQRAGHIITVSSVTGLIGAEGNSLYAASKFGVEGWMESLHPEVASYGIRTTVVEPGFFSTDLLQAGTWPQAHIADYADRTRDLLSSWQAQNGPQAGDPEKLAHALLTVAALPEPPQRFVAGDDALAAVGTKAIQLQEEVEASRTWGALLAHRDA
jgi:NAD(P)-dependent dehydrogenase (short-subunit alcohol dehydrogenase family)